MKRNLATALVISLLAINIFVGTTVLKRPVFREMSQEEWWDADFEYRVPINLTNVDTETREQVPVILKLHQIYGHYFDYSSINVESIRVITNTGLEIPYSIQDIDWIEGYSDYDLLNFLIDMPANSEKTLYFYYSQNQSIQMPSYLNYEDVINSPANLIRNPSFEIEDPGNPDNPSDCSKVDEPGQGAEAMWDDAISHTGEHSVKVFIHDDANISILGSVIWPGWFPDAVAVKPNTTYLFSGFTRVENSASDLHIGFHRLKSLDPYEWIGCMLAPFVYAVDPQVSNFFPGGVADHRRTTGWRFVLKEYTTYPDEHFARPLCTTINYGVKWYDSLLFYKNLDVWVGREERLVDEESRDYELWFADARKIFPNTRPKNITLEVGVARNEYEPFQVVITPHKDLNDVKIAVSDFVSNGHMLSKDNIKIALVDYVDVRDADFGYNIRGKWPDPLIPYNESSGFNVSAYQNQPIWFTVHVPENQPAGTYIGVITVTPSNAEQRNISVTIRVYDFELPTENHLRAVFNVPYTGWFKRAQYELIHGEGSWTGEMEMECFNEYLRKDVFEHMEELVCHRVAPFKMLGVPEAHYNESSGQLTFNTSIFDRLYEHGIDNGLNTVMILEAQGMHDEPWKPCIWICGRCLELFSEEYNHTLTTYISFMADHLEEKGWLEKAIGYTWDTDGYEVGYKSRFDTAYVSYIKGIYDLIKAGDPRLKVYHSASIAPELCGTLDIWGSYPEYYDENFARERQDLAEDVWFTLDGRFGMDLPLTQIRKYPWLCWKYNLRGFEFWSVAAWYVNVWENPKVGGDGEFPNGDGFLLYPGSDVWHDAPVDHFVPSIRWEAIRETMEDYEYFWLLDKLIKRAKAQEINATDAEIALARVNEMIDGIDFKDDPELLYEIRYQIAQEIENLKNLIPDVAVVTVTSSKTVVGQGYCVNITVNVENQGDFTETFNVTAYYNETAITLPDAKNHTTITLTSRNNTIITFPWNTTGVLKGNYTISANATILPGETDIADNSIVDGTIVVTFPGDCDGDYDVDSRDLFTLAPAYGSSEGDPLYNPACDFDDDGDVDSMDLFTLAPNYGKTA